MNSKVKPAPKGEIQSASKEETDYASKEETQYALKEEKDIALQKESDIKITKKELKASKEEKDIALQKETDNKNTKKEPKNKASQQLYAPLGGYQLQKNATKTQIHKKKCNEDPDQPILTDSSITWYPRWNGSFTALQSWITSQKTSKAFIKANTNSLLARVGQQKINFYTSTGSFQITKGKATKAQLDSLYNSMKEWLSQNHEEDHDMIRELTEILDPTKDTTPTKNTSRKPIIDNT